MWTDFEQTVGWQSWCPPQRDGLLWTHGLGTWCSWPISCYQVIKVEQRSENQTCRWIWDSKETAWTGIKYGSPQTSLGVQWLRLCTSNAGGAGSIPGWGTKIPHAVWCVQKQKRNKIYGGPPRWDGTLEQNQRGKELHSASRYRALDLGAGSSHPPLWRRFWSSKGIC